GFLPCRHVACTTERGPGFIFRASRRRQRLGDVACFQSIQRPRGPHAPHLGPSPRGLYIHPALLCVLLLHGSANQGLVGRAATAPHVPYHPGPTAHSPTASEGPHRALLQALLFRPSLSRRDHFRAVLRSRFTEPRSLPTWPRRQCRRARARVGGVCPDGLQRTRLLVPPPTSSGDAARFTCNSQRYYGRPQGSRIAARYPKTPELIAPVAARSDRRPNSGYQDPPLPCRRNGPLLG